MESGFDELEQKVRKAADVVRRLRQENDSLRKEAEAQRKEAEAQRRDAEARKATPPPDDKRAEALGREVEGLRAERDEIRRRIAKLVQVLDALDPEE